MVYEEKVCPALDNAVCFMLLSVAISVTSS